MAAPEPVPDQYNYPWATSPDILRVHQKDAYVSGTLSSQLNTVLRELLGARFAHRYHDTTTHLSELIYLCVTTLLGNRTLGEEYCDVLQLEDDTLRLAGLARRVGYIASVVFSPWIVSKSLPALRHRLRAKLERNIARAKFRQIQNKSQPSRSIRFQEYVLKHLDAITSSSPIYAISLATFYFTGAYYHISKRIFRLRYAFTRQLSPQEKRDGYEVLGVLLVLQMAVQSILHVRETFFPENDEASASARASVALPNQPTSAMVGPGIEVSVNSSSILSESLMQDLAIPSTLPAGLSTTIATPVPLPDTANYDVASPNVMFWIPSGQQRKCTLCLEPFKDPSATSCGHVFCWTCVQDWVKEKAECPLCRQACLAQKILPLRE